MESESKARRDRQGTLALSGFLGSAVVAIVLVGGSYWMSVRARQAQDWVAHTHEVRTAIAQMRADIVDIQNGHRGFVLTGDLAELEPYETARREVAQDLERLRALTADSPAQQASLSELDGYLQARLAIAASVVEARRSRGFEAAKAIIDRGVGRPEMAALRLLLQRMEAESSRLLAQRLAEHEQRVRAFTAGAAVLLLATIAALVFLYQQIQRKRQAEQRLLEGEQQFHAMTDSVTEYAILLLDADGTVRSWNPGARRIKGYEPTRSSAGISAGSTCRRTSPPACRSARWRRRRGRTASATKAGACARTARASGRASTCRPCAMPRGG